MQPPCPQCSIRNLIEFMICIRCLGRRHRQYTLAKKIPHYLGVLNVPFARSLCCHQLCLSLSRFDSTCDSSPSIYIMAVGTESKWANKKKISTGALGVMAIGGGNGAGWWWCGKQVHTVLIECNVMYTARVQCSTEPHTYTLKYADIPEAFVCKRCEKYLRTALETPCICHTQLAHK